MFKFLVKVIVGGVGVYAVNQYLERNKDAVEKLMEAGTQIAGRALTMVAEAAAARQQGSAT